jgi:6-phosphogluconate dehydrogenase
VSSLNAVQAGTNVDQLIDGLNAAIDQNDAQCNNASSAYQDFKNAIDDIRNR